MLIWIWILQAFGGVSDICGVDGVELIGEDERPRIDRQFVQVRFDLVFCFGEDFFKALSQNLH